MIEESLTSVVNSSLSQYLDDDACDYVSSILSDDPADEDAREAVGEFIRGSVEGDGEDEDTAESVVVKFFRLLDITGKDPQQTHQHNQPTHTNTNGGIPVIESTSTPRRLENAVTLKERDVQTFASGLVADVEDERPVGSEPKVSAIASFYANMIDPLNNEAVMSERNRRKKRQREIREEMEESERKRAVEDSVDALKAEDDLLGGDQGDEGDCANDNAKDVHFRNFDLPNLRGGGPDLLVNASLSLSKGRKYGLLGKNGCGKTTMMTFIANRQMGGKGGVPKNMTMLLVRQEIVGNDQTAIDTVLKSDYKRESIKRFIEWCEGEITRLENVKNGNNGNMGADMNLSTPVLVREEKVDKKSKGGRQKLRDKKKKSRVTAADKKDGNIAAKIDKVNTDACQEGNVEERITKLTSRLSKAYDRLAQMETDDGGGPEPRARKVLSGLGFTTAMQDKPTRELSGGWRMRVSLACALFAEPSLLLLDEPTNHLDLEAVLWLERYLTTKFKGTLLVVSHDRHFLNEVVTDVVHFHRNSLRSYRGDVTSHMQVMHDEKQRQIRQREIQEAKRVHLQKYVDLHAQAGENGVKAAKQRKSKMKKLDKLGVAAQGTGKRWKASYDGEAEEVEEFVEEEDVVLRFPDPGSFQGDIVKMDQVTFGYDVSEKPLLNKVDLGVNMQSRVALLGRNGCGKSTLIKLVCGSLEPTKGKVTINARAKIEYLAQHQLEQLDPDGTPLHTMIDRYPGDQSNSHIAELRRYLANFGLGGDILPNQKIHTLSGGQKCRLCLASAMYRRPHFLMLDEPTNHLDLETTEALIEAINKFQGGVLIVSHDQHLLTNACKQLLVVEDGNLVKLRQGTTNGEAFQAYKKAVIQGRR